MIKMLDTNTVLELQSQIFEEPFVLSSVVLEELESIKMSKNKDESTRLKARKIINLLISNIGKYEIVIYDKTASNILDQLELEKTPDNKICACAAKIKDVEFITNDLACLLIAKNIFGLNARRPEAHQGNDYKGFKEIVLSDEELASFYANLNNNTYLLLNNEYLIIKNQNNEIVDCRCWNGSEYRDLYKKKIQSLYFDKLKTKDIYQSCLVDSIMNNTLTAISGKAGSGKSLCSLMCAMSLIESGKYDSLVAMFNPSKARGTADLGAYKGSFIDKAMQNSIGNILTTKFGDRYIVDSLLQQEKLKLVSMADCRGMEIKDNEILWITEAENTTVDLIRLCLSRVSSGAKIIIEGDYEYQTDSYLFDGDNNGLRRVINKLKGQEEFGCIQLQNVWRSKIAELCELL